MVTWSKRSLADLQKHGPMRATQKVPAQERPTYYRAVGLQAAREAAGMTQAEVADLCGYSVGVIASMEAGTAYHTASISRAASVIPGHNLSLIRDEG